MSLVVQSLHRVHTSFNNADCQSWSVFMQSDSGGAHLVLRSPQGPVGGRGKAGNIPDDQRRWVATQTQGTVPQPLRLVCLSSKKKT